MTVADNDIERIIARMDRAKVSRRGFLAASGLTGVAAFLAACGASGSSNAPSAAASTAPTAAPSAAATAAASAAPSGPIGGTGTTEGAFYLYNWADYTDLNNIETFKTNYGVTDWSYDTFGSNDEMITTLQGGKIGQWDVSAPTADLVPTLVTGDFIQKIDWSKVPNATSLNPSFQKQWWDPTDEYSLPKDWGTTGITVRTKIVTEPVNTWKAFFDLAPKYSGRIIAVNSQGDVFAGALKALGHSLNTEDKAELDQMRDLLLAWAPHVLALNSDTYEVPLGNEEAVLGLTWTGGVSDLRKAPETADTQYIIPDDGTLYWVDTWVILKDAPHPEAAHAWLNFMYDPQINAIETETNQYATPVDAAKAYIPAATLDDPTIFIPDDVLKAGVSSGKLEVSKDWSANEQRADIWAEFSAKIGK
jgi:spermidine/putrescine transport system substrate-binding protein